MVNPIIRAWGFIIVHGLDTIQNFIFHERNGEGINKKVSDNVSPIKPANHPLSFIFFLEEIHVIVLLIQSIYIHGLTENIRELLKDL